MGSYRFSRVLLAINQDKDINFTPPQSRGQLASTVSARPRLWSLSRQHKGTLGGNDLLADCFSVGTKKSPPQQMAFVFRQLHAGDALQDGHLR